MWWRKKSQPEETDSGADRLLTVKAAQERLQDSSDVIFKRIQIGNKHRISATLLFIDGMVDNKLINDNIMKPLFEQPELARANHVDDLIELIEQGIVYYGAQKTREDLEDLIKDAC